MRHEKWTREFTRVNSNASIVWSNVGERLGKWLAIFPILYLSSGACIIYIIIGGAVMKIFFHSMCGGDPGCTASAPNGALCFLGFACAAIFMAQFFPNLSSLGWVTVIGSIAALAYCSLLWIVPLARGRPNNDVETVPVLLTGSPIRIRDAVVGFELLLLAFRGHNLVLEIQVSSKSQHTWYMCIHRAWCFIFLWQD